MNRKTTRHRATSSHVRDDTLPDLKYRIWLDTVLMQSKPNICRAVQVAQRPWLDHLPTTPVGQHARWPCGEPGVCMCTQPRARLGIFQGSSIRIAQPSTEPQSRAWKQGISRLCWSMQAQQPPIFRGRRPRTLAAITRALLRLWCRGVQIWIMGGWKRNHPILSWYDDSHSLHSLGSRLISQTVQVPNVEG